MTKAEIGLVAEGWIGYQLAPEGSSEQAANWTFVSTAFDIRAGDPKLLWELILAIDSRNRSDDVRCVLAAGPLEDLFVDHGMAYIEIIEQQACVDSEFAKLLDGVYRRSMSDDVWSRVTNIQNGVR
jgi:hypothetical protein